VRSRAEPPSRRGLDRTTLEAVSPPLHGLIRLNPPTLRGQHVVDHTRTSTACEGGRATMPWKPVPPLVDTPAGFALASGRERVPLMYSSAARKA
jgi:hypothetical protein